MIRICIGKYKERCIDLIFLFAVLTIIAGIVFGIASLSHTDAAKTTAALSGFAAIITGLNLILNAGAWLVRPSLESLGFHYNYEFMWFKNK